MPHLKTDASAPMFDLHPHELYRGNPQHCCRTRDEPLDIARPAAHAATTLDKAGYSLEQIGALLAHTRKGVTAIYARWDKFALRREMAMVVERALRETLDNKPAVVAARTAA